MIDKKIVPDDDRYTQEEIEEFDASLYNMDSHIGKTLIKSMDTFVKKQRISRCQACGSEVPSEVNLPFFVERPDMETDEHYDGCRGWE